MRPVLVATLTCALAVAGVTGCGKDKPTAHATGPSSTSIVTTSPAAAKAVSVSSAPASSSGNDAVGQGGGAAAASKRAADLSAVQNDLNGIDTGTKQADTDLGAADSAAQQPDN